jgi:hypothetical protein
MPSVVRDIAAEGIASIIRALPDECKIVLQIERLPRAKFDLLRCDEEAMYLPRSEVWMAVVPMGASVFLEIETTDPPALRAVS